MLPCSDGGKVGPRAGADPADGVPVAVGRQGAEVFPEEAEASQGAEARGVGRSEVGGRKSEVGGQRSEVEVRRSRAL
jgi:hypothetical protein